MVRWCLKTLTVVAVLVLPTVLCAQPVRSVDPMLDALQLPRILTILSDESVASGLDMDDTMLGGAGGETLASLLLAIHDPAVWDQRVRDMVEQALDPRHIAPITAFLTSAQGQKIIALELSARQAMSDPSIEAASRERVTVLQDRQDPLLDQVERFISTNDLIEANVVGALNANVAFMEGLQAGLGQPRGDVLTDVWSQEPQIRADTTAWLLAFLTMAYAPLETSDMEAYIAFSDTDAGQAFNLALFAAFDEMFVITSEATGLTLGRMMTAEDL